MAIDGATREILTPIGSIAARPIRRVLLQWASNARLPDFGNKDESELGRRSGGRALGVPSRGEVEQVAPWGFIRQSRLTRAFVSEQISLQPTSCRIEAKPKPPNEEDIRHENGIVNMYRDYDCVSYGKLGVCRRASQFAFRHAKGLRKPGYQGACRAELAS